MVAFSILILSLVGIYWYSSLKNSKWQLPKEPFPNSWKVLLIQHVSFYNTLSHEDKTKFEFKVQEFLLNCRITGIKTTIDTRDKMLVASSAIIPIFGFKDWKYTDIYEVLIYPSSFDENFTTEGSNKRILGMVGNGYMDGKMILSQKALRHGFQNESDKKNTAIHEFVHILDKSDGVIDGIPTLLLEKQYTIPWIDLINQKIDEIYQGETDINPYGGTNRAEFFSVTSEYFFERPKLLQNKHPKLYNLLEQIFKQEMSSKISRKGNSKIGRNDPCPCNSGNKFKKCCGKAY